MPMGIVSDAEFESALNNVTTPKKDKFVPPIPISDSNSKSNEAPKGPSNVVTERNTNDSGARESLVIDAISGEVVPFISRGRKLGDVNVPDSLRKMIAETAHIEGRESALKLASDFGVSASSVSAYTNGATSTKSYHNPNLDIIDYVRKRKGRVTKKALRVMTQSLDLLTPEKIATAKAKDVAAIARDMAAIVGNMADKTDVTNNNNGPTFVLYSPQQTEEQNFKAIPSHE